MKKSVLSILTIILLLLVIFLFQQRSQDIKEVCIENKACFQVEIADSFAERGIGLSDWEFLSNDSGMLFVFPRNSVPSFWMRDMSFPIDIIWIDENWKIVGIEKKLQPCQKECSIFYPTKEVKYVLETNSGLAERYDFEEGDFVKTE